MKFKLNDIILGLRMPIQYLLSGPHSSRCHMSTINKNAVVGIVNDCFAITRRGRVKGKDVCRARGALATGRSCRGPRDRPSPREYRSTGYAITFGSSMVEKLRGILSRKLKILSVRLYLPIIK